MKPPLITGFTEDKRFTVYSNLFKWKDQEGLPIEVVAKYVIDEGYAIDWLYEIEGALWQGFTPDQIRLSLKETFQFLFSPDETFMLMGKVNFYLENRGTPNAYTLQAMKLTKL